MPPTIPTLARDPRAWALVVIGLVALHPAVGTAGALAIGLAVGLCLRHPWAQSLRKSTTLLLQASVVMLGFKMNLNEVVRAGVSGGLFAFIGIAATLAVGLALGRMLRITPRLSALIASGTAIWSVICLSSTSTAMRAMHKRALMRNMATSLMLHGRIETTVAKAKEVRDMLLKEIAEWRRPGYPFRDRSRRSVLLVPLRASR